MSEALAERLLAASGELNREVLAEMYRDPFWYARFGEPRADKHGRQDGDHHVSYLVEALRSGDAGVLERYARWLQQVLTTRGMCTRHLAEHFERLGEAIAARGWPDAARAAELLAAAVAALRYDEGPARAIQDRAASIAALGDPELATLAWYLADAVALGTPAVFAKHVAWYARFVEQQGAPAGTAAERLDRLCDAILRALPEHRDVIGPTLDAATAAVRPS